MPKRKENDSHVVGSTQFQATPGFYQEMTHEGPVIIKKHNQPRYVLLSFRDYQKLTGNTKRAMHPSQIPPADLALIATAEVPEEYAHLDELMKD